MQYRADPTFVVACPRNADQPPTGADSALSEYHGVGLVHWNPLYHSNFRRYKGIAERQHYREVNLLAPATEPLDKGPNTTRSVLDQITTLSKILSKTHNGKTLFQMVSDLRDKM